MAGFLSRGCIIWGMKKRHNDNTQSRGVWTSAKRAKVRAIRAAETKSNQRFWESKSSVDYNPEMGESPYLSDIGYAAAIGTNSEVDRMLNCIDREMVEIVDREEEALERDWYEAAVNKACVVVERYAPHCLDSLKDFINNQGNREATICAIMQRVKNQKYYQKRKKAKRPSQGGASRRKPGADTAARSPES